MNTPLILQARVGTTPELHTSPTGRVYARFRVAASTASTAADGSRQWATQWHTVTAWGSKAQVAAKLLDKGDKILLGGIAGLRTWTGRDGQQHQDATITLRTFALLPKTEAAR